MDRISRKKLKTDHFQEEVNHTFSLISEHRSEVIRYGGIALAVILVAGGIYFYMRHEAAAREVALGNALALEDVPVGPAAQPGALSFPTQAAKDQARDKAFLDIAQKYSGSLEGSIARTYLASEAADKGNLAEAERQFKIVADTAPSTYASVAKLSLADVYAAEGKESDAEQVIRSVIANPTILVSKDQATLKLAQIMATKDPAGARKLLEPLRTQRTVVSRAAIAAMADMSQPPSPPAH